MKKVLLSIIIICSMASAVMAQAAGFMGKRVSFHYSFNFFPNVFGLDGRVTPLYMQHQASMACIINKRLSIEAGYAFHRSQMNLQEYTDLYSYYQNAPSTVAGHMTVHEGFVSLKVFATRKGFMAPFGRYGKFGIGVARVTSSTGTPLYMADLPAYNEFLVKMGFGRQFVVFNRMTIDYGFDVQIAPASIARARNKESLILDFNNGSYDYNDKYTANEKMLGDKMLTMYLMQLHITLGFLAF